MTTIHPYPRQQAIMLVISAIGVIGTTVLILNLLFDWKMNQFSLGVYPIFLSQIYLYIEMRKNTIEISKDRITWKLANMKTRKSVELNGEKVGITSDWKGLSIRKGEDLIEISLDSVWEKDRKKVMEKLTTYYS